MQGRINITNIPAKREGWKREKAKKNELLSIFTGENENFGFQENGGRAFLQRRNGDRLWIFYIKGIPASLKNRHIFEASFLQAGDSVPTLPRCDLKAERRKRNQTRKDHSFTIAES